MNEASLRIFNSLQITFTVNFNPGKLGDSSPGEYGGKITVVPLDNLGSHLPSLIACKTVSTLVLTLFQRPSSRIRCGQFLAEKSACCFKASIPKSY